MLNFDRREIGRVTEYNLRLVTCWARGRLVQLVRSQQVGQSGHASAFPPRDEMRIAENTEQFERLVLCEDRLKEAKLILQAPSLFSPFLGWFPIYANFFVPFLTKSISLSIAVHQRLQQMRIYRLRALLLFVYSPVYRPAV